MLFALLLAAATSGLRLNLVRSPRATVVLGPRLKVSFLKEQLAAAGVSTAGIVEKEELLRLYEALEVTEQAPLSVPLVELQGGAYAELNTGKGGALRLLVDSGASVSILGYASSQRVLPGAVPGSRAPIPCPGLPGLRLECTVGSPQQYFPAGVDGVLGIDCLRSFSAVELDWARRELKLHAVWSEADGGAGRVSIPMTMRAVSAGVLPFVEASFVGDSASVCTIKGLVDTGSPVTMVTPELCTAAAMAPSASTDDIMTTGVDGSPARMVASSCATVLLGGGADGAAGLAHRDAVCFAGMCPMMAMVGWQGTAAGLIGLDLLRRTDGEGGTWAAGAGPTSTPGLPCAGRLILDFERGRLIVT